MELSNSSGFSLGVFLLVLIVVIAIWLFTSHGGGSITLIDTDIAPTITEDNKLRVTLQDGSEVELVIRDADADGEETTKAECGASVYRANA